MNLNTKVAFVISGLIGLSAVSRADYILDTPLSDYILDGPSIATAWYFKDVQFKAGQQIRADVRVSNGALEFTSTSTILPSGAPAGLKVFSSYGTTVVGYEWAFVDNRKLYVKAVLADGTTQIVTPNFANGVITPATLVSGSSEGTAARLTSPDAGTFGAGWTFGDEDASTDGVQINGWVEFNKESGVIRFRTDSTCDEETGRNCGPKTINRVGDNTLSVRKVKDIFFADGKVYVVAKVREQGDGAKTLVFTTNFEAGTAARAIVPTVDYILD
ncbi:hypothetical protein MCEMSE15_02728 [Fimbriimonadaceae bacterium]